MPGLGPSFLSLDLSGGPSDPNPCLQMVVVMDPFFLLARLRTLQLRLSALPFFKADYLNWLREFRFNPEQVTVSNDNGKRDIRLSGPWREVILWEVPLLAVISEMVHRYRSPQADVAQATLPPPPAPTKST